MNRLNGKVAIMNGARANMGREEAILFAREVAEMVVFGTIPERGEETVKIVTGQMVKPSSSRLMFRRHKI